MDFGQITCFGKKKIFMNNTLKKIGTIALVGGGAFLIYKGLKKYVIKSNDEETSSDTPTDVSLQINPTDAMGGDGVIDLKEYTTAKMNKKIGDKILGNEKETKETKKTEQVLKNEGSKIKGGITYKDYFIRVSTDGKGRLVVGKKNGVKSVYKVFGTLFLPLKVKSIYDGNFAFKDVDFNPVNKDSKVIEPIKFIDNTNKIFYVQKVELDNILKRLETNSKKFKVITDKADFTLTKI